MGRKRRTRDEDDDDDDNDVCIGTLMLFRGQFIRQIESQ